MSSYFALFLIKLNSRVAYDCLLTNLKLIEFPLNCHGNVNRNGLDAQFYSKLTSICCLHDIHGLYNLEKVLNFTSCLEKSLNSV